MDDFYIQIQQVYKSFKSDKRIDHSSCAIDLLELIWMAKNVLEQYQKQNPLEVIDEDLSTLVGKFLKKPRFNTIEDYIIPVIDQIKSHTQNEFVKKVIKEITDVPFKPSKD